MLNRESLRLNRQQIPQRRQWQSGLLGHLDKSPQVFVYRGQNLYRVAPNQTENPPEENVVSAAWLPARQRAQSWHFATTTDLDKDQDADAIVAVRREAGMVTWLALTNNVADRDGIPSDEFGFRGEAVIANAALEDDSLDRAFAVSFDVDNDGRPDVVTYNGQRDGKLGVYLNRRRSGRIRQGGAPLRFISRSVIDANRSRKLNDLYLAFPFDADFDGWTDLLVAARGQDAVIFYNFAPGAISSFSATTLPGTEFEIERVGLTDADGDGRSDLIVLPVNQANQPPLLLFFNDGQRQFVPRN